VTNHPHDISAEHLQLALQAASRPDLLLKLVETSRRSFGFYTRHFPHTINYPWAASLLEDLPPGARALEIGAGLNPLPIFLAERGVLVECVDHSTDIRRAPAADWNEWGFFDYSGLHANLISHNCSIVDFRPSSKFEAIYSIGSLAHMRRAVWEETLEHCREWMVAGGQLVLAVGVIAGTDFLWNRIDDPELETEDPVAHGSVDDMIAKLKKLGFNIGAADIRRRIPTERKVDMLLLHCRSPS
jgi:hypothetical protein